MLAEKEAGTDANNKSSLPALIINNMHIASCGYKTSVLGHF